MKLCVCCALGIWHWYQIMLLNHAQKLYTEKIHTFYVRSFDFWPAEALQIQGCFRFSTGLRTPWTTLHVYSLLFFFLLGIGLWAFVESFMTFECDRHSLKYFFKIIYSKKYVCFISHSLYICDLSLLSSSSGDQHCRRGQLKWSCWALIIKRKWQCQITSLCNGGVI